MSDEKQFRKEAFIGKIVDADADFNDSDYIRLPTGGDDDLVLSRASYPELSALLPNLNKKATVNTNINNPTGIFYDSFGGTISLEFATGQAIAISGDGTRMVISATGEDSVGSGAGKIYWYRYDTNLAIWVFEASQAHPDGDGSSNAGFFGWSVDMDETGTRTVATALRRPGTSISTGVVYIYSRSGTVWTQEVRIDNPQGLGISGYFGHTCHFDENADRVAIGASRNTVGATTLVGRVYVYKRSGTAWSLEADIPAPVELFTSYFAKWMIMNKQGNVIFASSHDGEDQCRIECFQRDGTTWSHKYTIFQPINASADFDGIKAHNWGKMAMSQSPSGNGKDEQYLVISEYTSEFPHDHVTVPPAGQGIVHIYDISNGGDDIYWDAHHAKHIYTMSAPEANEDPVGDERIFFGADVKISADGRYLVVTGPYFDQSSATRAGRAWIFENNGYRWDLIDRLDGLGAFFEYYCGVAAHASSDFSKIIIGTTANIFTGAVVAYDFEPDTTNMTFRPVEGKNKFMRVK